MPELAFLLDANMPRSAGDVVRGLGFGVEDVRDIGMASATDDEIVAYARDSKRIIVTRDTDFGAVLRHPDHPGALILRLPYTFTAVQINERLRTFLATVDVETLSGAVVIVGLNRFRRRPIR